MIVYFDSSAVVKLLLKEDGWRVVRDLWATATRRVVSRIAYTEVRAGLAAAVRSRRIGPGTLDDAIDDLNSSYMASNVIDVDVLMAVGAGQLTERYALRGYDAVHLASALSVRTPRLVVATWDRRLSQAVTACGYAVVPERP
jgi:predicted nucleic acid-binding protein